MARLESVDPIKLGERLRAARAAKGLTQGRVAEAIGIGRTTLVAIERGERRVRPPELVALADTYGLSVNSLLAPHAVHVNVQGHFRANAASEDSKEAALGLLLQLATGYVELERSIGRPLRPRVEVPEYPARGGSLAHSEDAATFVRSMLGRGLAPITDIMGVAEVELGLRVFVRPLKSNVSGAYIYHDELGGCVLINRNHPRERRAWTIAHEIGHYVGERRDVDVLALGEASDDHFADAFAGAFLMPPAALRMDFQKRTQEGRKFSTRDLIFAAYKYQVSIEAMCRWLERLGLLPKQTFEALRDRGLSRSVVRQVVGDPAPDQTTAVPPRLLLIAAEAFHEGKASEGQLVQLLGIERLKVRELLDEIPPSAFDQL